MDVIRTVLVKVAVEVRLSVPQALAYSEDEIADRLAKYLAGGCNGGGSGGNVQIRPGEDYVWVYHHAEPCGGKFIGLRSASFQKFTT